MHAGSDTYRWPDISVARWAPTKRSLHLYSQMLGKLMLSLNPPQPNWMFTRLSLDARGFTTGPMPYEYTAVEALIDVFSAEIILRRSTGREARIDLTGARSVAEVFAGLHSALAELDVRCAISPAPQEIPDTTPLDQDTGPAEFDSDAVRRWFSAATATGTIFGQWRSHFFGRSGIQLWWGAFDVALILFNGRHVPPPLDRGYLMKYDLDAELMNCGLYLGDENTPPFFYGYIFPQPPGAEQLSMLPAAVRWSEEFSEWVLPYDAVRNAADPAVELHAFMDSLYEHCVTVAGWNRADLSYDAPKQRRKVAKLEAR